MEALEREKKHAQQEAYKAYDMARQMVSKNCKCEGGSGSPTNNSLAVYQNSYCGGTIPTPGINDFATLIKGLSLRMYLKETQ